MVAMWVWPCLAMIVSGLTAVLAERPAPEPVEKLAIESDGLTDCPPIAPVDIPE